MEIKDYYQVLRKNSWLILVITIGFGLIAYLFSLSAKPSYQSSVSLEIDRIPSQSQTDVPYYQYDNFYSSAVSATLAGNLVDWLTAPSTITQVFEKAGYQLPASDIKGLSKIFAVSKKQESSSVISATYGSSDRTQAEKVLLSASDILKEKVANYNKSDSSAKFITRSNEPVVVEVPKQTTLNTLIALFIGFIISLGVVSIREALR